MWVSSLQLTGADPECTLPRVSRGLGSPKLTSAVCPSRKRAFQVSQSGWLDPTAPSPPGSRSLAQACGALHRWQAGTGRNGPTPKSPAPFSATQTPPRQPQRDQNKVVMA